MQQRQQHGIVITDDRVLDVGNPRDRGNTDHRNTDHRRRAGSRTTCRITDQRLPDQRLPDQRLPDQRLPDNGVSAAGEPDVCRTHEYDSGQCGALRCRRA
jgi:hypothetical protein